MNSLLSPNLSSLSPITDIQTQSILQNALSDSTKKAYATDWQIFSDFCLEKNLVSLPASQQTIIAFLTEQSQAQKALQTIRRRLAAIKFIHNIQGHDININDKMITLLLKGIARERKSIAPNKKKPITADILIKMLAYCDTNTLIGKRDKALLLFGFSGAFRRSELCSLTLDDLEETSDGLKVHISHSKGDQFGQGQVVALPYGQKMGAIDALKDYLQAANIYDGFIFRSISKNNRTIGEKLTPLSVALIVKKYISAVGYNPDEYAAHSMRSGFLTEAADNGANLFKMLEVSRHKSTDTLLEYIRQSDLFKNHAGKDFL